MDAGPHAAAWAVRFCERRRVPRLVRRLEGLWVRIAQRVAQPVPEHSAMA